MWYLSWVLSTFTLVYLGLLLVMGKRYRSEGARNEWQLCLPSENFSARVVLRFRISCQTCAEHCARSWILVARDKRQQALLDLILPLFASEHKPSCFLAEVFLFCCALLMCLCSSALREEHVTCFHNAPL